MRRSDPPFFSMSIAPLLAVRESTGVRGVLAGPVLLPATAFIK